MFDGPHLEGHPVPSRSATGKTQLPSPEAAFPSTSPTSAASAWSRLSLLPEWCPDPWSPSPGRWPPASTPSQAAWPAAGAACQSYPGSDSLPSLNRLQITQVHHSDTARPSINTIEVQRVTRLVRPSRSFVILRGTVAPLLGFSETNQSENDLKKKKKAKKLTNRPFPLPPFCVVHTVS